MIGTPILDPVSFQPLPSTTFPEAFSPDAGSVLPGEKQHAAAGHAVAVPGDLLLKPGPGLLKGGFEQHEIRSQAAPELQPPAAAAVKEGRKGQEIPQAGAAPGGLRGEITLITGKQQC